jgi:hypothetical protein
MRTRRVISLVCALALLGSSPGSAYQMQPFVRPAPADFMVACLADTADATTYNSAAWQSLSTGRADEDAVAVWVGVVGEDGTTTFGVNSVSIDGGAMQEVVDEDGSGLINTALYRANSGAPAITTSFIKNAAQVNISVTFSEAITGAAICVFTFKNSEMSGAGTPTLGFIADDDTASGALVLTLGAGPVYTGKIIFGICASQDAAATTTWAVIAEQTDAASAEFSYSSAATVVPDATSSAAPAITCDYSGAGDSSGSAANSGP